MDEFVRDEEDVKDKQVAHVLENQVIDLNRYEYDFKFKPWQIGDAPESIHSIPCLMRYLESDENALIDANQHYMAPNRKLIKRHGMNRESLLEAWNRGNKITRFRESVDYFQDDQYDYYGNSIGQDFVPLLGGPFSKQLYYFPDFIKMHQEAFFSVNHDPVAKRIIHTHRQFTMGKGFRVDCEDKGALALLMAFFEANDFYRMMDDVATEFPTYGEVMVYWLPDNQANLTYRLPEEEIPRAILPRVRLIDPSTIWEIVTFPEDIKRVIFYQQVFPTQYQIYTGGVVPSMKFIYDQIPADLIMHFKKNCVSNEKRGRSDLVQILGYLKRLRDSVNYNLVRQIKDSAWCIDTTIEGSQADITAYINSQNALGPLPPAASEFVHTKKVQREYLNNSSGAGSGNFSTFEWTLSMIAMGSGLPISYFGTHIQGGSTRAGAIVATEPVAKMFEEDQKIYENIILKISDRFLKWAGYKNVKVEVSFPEIITQDRSQKIKDLALAESQGWISRERAAEIAAKEMGITDFDFQGEVETIKTEQKTMPVAQPISPDATDTPLSTSSITSDEKTDIKDQNYTAG